jgi:hypothetical protein
MKTNNAITEAKQLINKLDRINLYTTILKIVCVLFIFTMCVLSIYL